MNFSCKGRHLMVEFQRKDFYSYEDFLEIMRLLRAPGGCPWDREQTHESIRRNMLEEAYEAPEAIDEKNPEHLKEELGDVLLQVVFHAQMAKEEGLFTFQDVVDGVAKVDEDKCKACNQCVDICPRHIIALEPYKTKKHVTIPCSSKDKGPAVTKVCSNGCIGCSLCAKSCPKEAITMVDNLAHIDYDKCIGCGICAQKCPRKLITVDGKVPEVKPAAPKAAPAAAVKPAAPAAEKPAAEAAAAPKAEAPAEPKE